MKKMEEKEEEPEKEDEHCLSFPSSKLEVGSSVSYRDPRLTFF